MLDSVLQAEGEVNVKISSKCKAKRARWKHTRHAPERMRHVPPPARTMIVRLTPLPAAGMLYWRLSGSYT